MNMKTNTPSSVSECKQSQLDSSQKDRKETRDLERHSNSQAITADRQVFNQKDRGASAPLQQWDLGFYHGSPLHRLIDSESFNLVSAQRCYRLSGTEGRNSAGRRGCILGQRG